MKRRLLDAVIAVALVIAVCAPVVAILGHGVVNATFAVVFVISLAIFAAVARVIGRDNRPTQALEAADD